MPSRRPSCAGASRALARITLVASLTAPALLFVPGASAAPLPTGHARGVRVTVAKRAVTFRFGPFTRFDVRYLVEARRTELSCTWLQPPRLDGFRPWATYSDRLRAPRHIRVLRLHLPNQEIPSFCSVFQVKPVHRSLVDVPITEDGAIYLDARTTMLAVRNGVDAASFDAKDAGVDAFPTSAQIVEEYSHSNSGTAVALATPDDTPPPGKLGVFSDGAHHFEAVKLTTLGKRLFYDVSGDVVTTNGETYLDGP